MPPYPQIDLVATGTNIREIIREAGYTVSEISDYLGVNRSSLYKVIRGESLLSIDNLFALSILLERSLNDILIAA